MKTYKITVNGITYDVAVEETNGIAAAPAAPAPVAASAAVAATPAALAPVAPQAAPKPAAATAGSVRVDSPLPGSVLDYKVQVGDTVQKGQVLVLIEAMKMENELVSPCDGVIASLVADKGALVNPGDLLLTIQE